MLANNPDPTNSFCSYLMISELNTLCVSTMARYLIYFDKYIRVQKQLNYFNYATWFNQISKKVRLFIKLFDGRLYY